MNRYIFFFVLWSVILPFLKCLLSDFGTIKRYMLMCASIIMVYSLLAPLYNLVMDIPRILEEGRIDEYTRDISSYDEYEKLIVEQTDRELRYAICEIARTRFDINVEAERITISYDTQDLENVEILSIKIDVSDELSILNLNELSGYISDMFMCECEVIAL